MPIAPLNTLGSFIYDVYDVRIQVITECLPGYQVIWGDRLAGATLKIEGSSLIVFCVL